MKPPSVARPLSILLLVVVLLAILGVIGWRALGDRGEGGRRTASVRRGTLRAAIETSGRLAARRGPLSVSSPAGGRVKIVAVRAGEPVRQGDVLIVLDDAPARADVLRAERAVEAAESRVGVARARAAANDSALPDVAATEGEAANARAALGAANDRLVATLILAPVDGVVDALKVTEGETFEPNSEALTLVDPADLIASVEIDEVDRPLVREGQEATVTATAFPGSPLTGRIASLSSSAQSRAGTTLYALTIEFERPRDLALLPGYTVEVRIVTAAREAVLLLPSEAIRRAGERQYVVVRRGGREEEVEVRPGARSGGEVEILSGLAEGDVVVLR